MKVVRMLKKAAGDVILRNVFWYFELEVFVHSCHVFHHIWWMHFCVTISGFRQSWTSPLWPIAVDEPNTSGWSFVCAWVLPPAILANQLWTLDFFPLTKSGEGYTGFGTLVSWKEASRRAHCSLTGLCFIEEGMIFYLSYNSIKATNGKYTNTLSRFYTKTMRRRPKHLLELL